MPVADRFRPSAFATVRRMMLVLFFLILPLAEPPTFREASTGMVGIGIGVGAGVASAVFSSCSASFSCSAGAAGVSSEAGFTGAGSSAGAGSAFGASSAGFAGSAGFSGAVDFSSAGFAASGAFSGSAGFSGAFSGAAGFSGAGAATSVTTAAGSATLSARTSVGRMPNSIVATHRMDRYRCNCFFMVFPLLLWSEPARSARDSRDRSHRPFGPPDICPTFRLPAAQL